MTKETIREMRYKVSDIHHELCTMHSKIYKEMDRSKSEETLLFNIMGATTSNIYALCMTLSKMLE